MEKRPDRPHTYVDLVSAWERAEAKLAALSDDDVDAERAAVREWWYYAAGLLSYHARGLNAVPLPKELANCLFTVSYALHTGATPELVDKARGRGKPAESARVMSSRYAACAYVQAALAGEVSDPNPVTTVCTRFGVADRRTINRWLREFPDARALHSSLDHVLNAFDVASEVYRNEGPTQKAVAGRVRGRRDSK